MRLIDADKLYKDLANGLAWIIEDKRDRKSIDVCAIGKTIHKVFSAQPTAYDVDAVVEQLEDLKKVEQDKEDECDEDGFGDGEQIFSDGRSQGKFEAFAKAIEIVKGGGVDAN